MPNLENLISKIINDCEEKARLIAFNAEKKATEIAGESAAAAEKEKERILAGANVEAERSAELLVAGKRLEIRDDHLVAKRQVIDKVFDRALNSLNGMPKEEFWDFLGKSLPNMDFDGCEIVMPKKYGFKVDELNAMLAKKGAAGALIDGDDDRDVKGGFILVKEGVESNNTFETLINYYRDELESEIIAKLF